MNRLRLNNIKFIKDDLGFMSSVKEKKILQTFLFLYCTTSAKNPLWKNEEIR